MEQAVAFIFNSTSAITLVSSTIFATAAFSARCNLVFTNIGT